VEQLIVLPVNSSTGVRRLFKKRHNFAGQFSKQFSSQVIFPFPFPLLHLLFNFFPSSSSFLFFYFKDAYVSNLRNFLGKGGDMRLVKSSKVLPTRLALMMESIALKEDSTLSHADKTHILERLRAWQEVDVNGLVIFSFFLLVLILVS
jgi:hypothetical protein